MRWHQSLIFRGALLAVTVYLIGFAASTLSILNGLNSFAEIAQNDEIEKALAGNVSNIKEIYSLRQALYGEQIRTTRASWRASHPNQSVTPDTVRQWLDSTDLSRLEAGTPFTVTPFDPAAHPDLAGGDAAKDVHWINRDTLKIEHWVVAVPRGELFDSYKTAEGLHHAYLLIGATLHSQIIPRTLKFHGIGLGVVLVLALIGFGAMSRRVQRQVGRLLQGFTTWSEQDNSFRFGPGWSGELKLITSQFNVMADEVEANRRKNLYLEKIASWQVIARKLAHEVKNPLTPIQMMVSQLKRKYSGGDPDYTKLLDDAQSIISEEITGLRRMVDSFSSFARLPQPMLQPTNLNEVCRQVVELQKVAFPGHTIIFRASHNAGSPDAMVPADDQLVRQVLLNLIKNAAEAAGDHGEIVVSCEVLSKTAMVQVQDNGPGIPPEMLGKIFEAYVTTKHTGPSPGMGLGLAICQKIMLDHDGDLTVTSNPGKTIFTMKFQKNMNPAHTGPKTRTLVEPDTTRR